ncbi:MAG: D-alanyl-D-alanine endopeptidase [Thiomonas sp.]
MRLPHAHPLIRLQGLLLAVVMLLGVYAVPALAADIQTQRHSTANKSEARKSAASAARSIHHGSTKRSMSPARVAAKETRKTSIRHETAHIARGTHQLAGRKVPQRRPVGAEKNANRTMTTAREAQREAHPVAGRTLPVSSSASGTARADRFQVSAASTAVNDDPVFLRSGSALVVDEGTGRILLSKNADIARPIASLTKLMTAAVVLDAHQPMDQVIEITDADIDTLKWSASRLRPGTKLTREELLKLALMSSENRAAHALARNYPGGLPAFVAAMNAKARALGMNSTHYVEPTGLSPQNESTAHDLALLVKAAYHYPLIRAFSTHPESEVDIGSRTLQFRNTDHLVFNRGWDILLQKTGYINEAGHCLVLQAQVEGRRVIVVLLDAWGKYSHFGDAQRIRNWLQTKGFAAVHDDVPLRPEARSGHDSARGLVRTARVGSAQQVAIGE